MKTRSVYPITFLFLSFFFPHMVGIYGQNGSPAVTINSILPSFSQSTVPLVDATLEGTVLFTAGTARSSGNISLLAKLGGYTKIREGLELGSRIEIHSPSKTGRPVRKIWDSNGASHDSTQDMLFEPYWFDPEMLLHAMSHDTSWQIQKQGFQTVDGRQLFELWIARILRTPTPPNSSISLQSSISLLLDPQTGLPSRMTYRLTSGTRLPGTGKESINWSDYHMIDGRLLPLHITESVNGTLRRDIHITAARFNTGLDASTFVAP